MQSHGADCALDPRLRPIALSTSAAVRTEVDATVRQHDTAGMTMARRHFLRSASRATIALGAVPLLLVERLLA